MTALIITPVSNTIVTIPSYVLAPSEGEYYPLQQDTTSTNLFVEIATSGRSGIFTNPVSANIAALSDVANTFTAVVLDVNNGLSEADRLAISSRLISVNAQISFSEAPANTSNIDVRYTIKGNVSISDTFVANGAQTSFALQADPQRTQIPSVFVNGVHQSNTAFDFVPKAYGLTERLSQLLAHTNRLSGLESAIFAEDIDLEKTISLGTALNTLVNGLNNETYNANNVMYCMSALFCQSILDDYKNQISGGLTLPIISNTANVTFTYSALDGMLNGVTNIIDSDVDFYRQVENQITLSTLSAFVTTVYSEPSGKFLLKYVIGTDRLKEILGE